MASSVTWTMKTAFGNVRVLMGTATMTDGSDEVASGLNYIHSGQATVQTSATNGVGLVLNGTANGGISFQSCVSGSVYHVIVYGK